MSTQNETVEIYKLKLHHYTWINDDIKIIRVPGGWIYMYYDNNDTSHTFVPFNNEFSSLNEPQIIK